MSPQSLIGPVTHPDVISREGFMHFNLTPPIIISRTSRFSLSSCPSRDKHNLFAIKPNKYVCAGDGTIWGGWPRPGKQRPALTRIWAAGLLCVSLSRRPVGSQVSGRWPDPDRANENAGQPAAFEFQMNDDFFLLSVCVPLNTCKKKKSI